MSLFWYLYQHCRFLKYYNGRRRPSMYNIWVHVGCKWYQMTNHTDLETIEQVWIERSTAHTPRYVGLLNTLCHWSAI